MSLDLTPEQKATGKANFEQAVGDLARGGKMNGTEMPDFQTREGGAVPDGAADQISRRGRSGGTGSTSAPVI